MTELPVAEKKHRMQEKEEVNDMSNRIINPLFAPSIDYDKKWKKSSKENSDASQVIKKGAKEHKNPWIERLRVY